MPTLVGALVSMRDQAQQAMLDAFFGSLGEQPCCNWQRDVSERGFAKARARLDPRCLQDLNTWLVDHADAMGLVARWHGLRVVAINLPAENFPCAVFADLYHQRWRIEEGFKRLKHRAKLESVSGLTQQALLVDVAAKVLADNMGSLLCNAGGEQAELASRQRVCNRVYAAPLLQRVLPRVVLGLGCLLELLDHAIAMLTANTHLRVKDRSQPRPQRRVKPHAHLAYKG